MSINVCTFSGHLGKDPKVTLTESGKTFAHCTIAIRNYRPAGEDATLWVKLSSWGHAANALGLLKAGALVTVSGRLDEEVWTDKEGVKQKTLVLNVSDIQLPPKEMAQEEPVTTF